MVHATDMSEYVSISQGRIQEQEGKNTCTVKVQIAVIREYDVDLSSSPVVPAIAARAPHEDPVVAQAQFPEYRTQLQAIAERNSRGRKNEGRRAHNLLGGVYEIIANGTSKKP